MKFNEYDWHLISSSGANKWEKITLLLKDLGSESDIESFMFQGASIQSTIIYFDKIILYGKIEKNKFDIKYIFEFDIESDLTKEITEITKGVESYIRTKSVFIDNIRDDIASPIISNFKIIGNVYKYNSYNDFISVNVSVILSLSMLYLSIS